MKFIVCKNTSLIFFVTTSLAVACIPERKPLATLPAPTKTTRPEGQEQKPVERPPVDPNITADELNKLSDQCATQHDACLKLGDYWKKNSDAGKAYTYYTSACNLFFAKNLDIAPDQSGCFDAFQLAGADKKPLLGILSCYTNSTSSNCMDLCAQQFGSNTAQEFSSRLTPVVGPPFWPVAAPAASEAIPDIAAAQAQCGPYLGTVTPEITGWNTECAANAGGAGCIALANAIKNGAATLTGDPLKASKRCSGFYWERSCLAGKATVNSCMQASMAYEGLSNTALPIRGSFMGCLFVLGANIPAAKSWSSRSIVSKCNAAPIVLEPVEIEACQKIAQRITTE